MALCMAVVATYLSVVSEIPNVTLSLESRSSSLGIRSGLNSLSSDETR
jgi:hypothetical protein